MIWRKHLINLEFTLGSNSATFVFLRLKYYLGLTVTRIQCSFFSVLKQNCIFNFKAKQNKTKQSKKKRANSTRSSQAVSHLSTILAQCCLTSVIGRELVCSTWYGRWQEGGLNIHIKNNNSLLASRLLAQCIAYSASINIASDNNLGLKWYLNS